MSDPAAEVAYDRTRYELLRRNQASMRAINALAQEEALTVLSAGLDLERYEYAGFARTVLTPIVDKWGNVSAQTALNTYEQARSAWLEVMETRTFTNTWGVERARVINGVVTVLQPGETITVDLPRREIGIADANRRSRNYAAKVTQGQIYRAQLPEFDPKTMTDPIMAEAMKAYSEMGPEAANTAAGRALTRQIGAYNRDTMLFNSALDESVVGVQRVVNPNGCAWCKTLAVGGIGRSRRKVLDYAVNFHPNCRCAIEPLYAGDKPLRPDYYDDIEKDLKRAQRGEYDDVGQRALRKNANTNASIRSEVQALRSVMRDNGIGNEVSNVIEEVRNSINNATTGGELGEIVGKYFGDIPVSGFSNRNLSLEQLKEVSTTLVDLKNTYPQARMDYLNIKSFGRSRAFAWVKSSRSRATGELVSLGMEINSRVLNRDTIDEFAEKFRGLIDRGYFTKVDTDAVSFWQYTVTHEFGHILDYSKDKISEVNVTGIKGALSDLNGLPYPSAESAQFMRSQMSQYGQTNNREYVAESFTDVTFNGENASQLSRAIWNVVEDGLKNVG